MRRPEIGDTVLLVYRECPCGFWCATGEGAAAPLCSGCGKMMLPLGGLAPSEPAEDKERLGRANRGLGFVAFFTNEIAAVGLLGKIRGFLGISKARFAHDPFGNSSGDRGPYALDGEVSGYSLEKVRTHDDLMQTVMALYRWGSKSKLFEVTEDTAVRLWDLRSTKDVDGPEDPTAPIETPFRLITPFGDVLVKLAAWRGDGSNITQAWRCTCPRDPHGPADQEHEEDPSCPRHSRRHG